MVRWSDAKNDYEYLMVQSASTYNAGNIYGGGKYIPNTIDQDFVDLMTQSEKQRFATDTASCLNFLAVFDRCYSEMRTRLYQTQEQNKWHKFRNDRMVEHKTILPDLQRLIGTSTAPHGFLPWGFAKGRPNPGESSCDAAIREFCEETGADQHMFQVISSQIDFTISYVDGLAYEFNFYFAEPTPNFACGINNANIKQTSEVADLKWLTISEFARKDMCPITRNHIFGNMKAIENKYISLRGAVNPAGGLPIVVPASSSASSSTPIVASSSTNSASSSAVASTPIVASSSTNSARYVPKSLRPVSSYGAPPAVSSNSTTRYVAPALRNRNAP